MQQTDRDRSRQSGFTMIEILVVVLVIGLSMRIVVANLGTWIPETALDAEAARIRSWLDYIRSEAKIQGKPYSLEIDLEDHTSRLVLPPEDKLVTTMDDTISTAIPLGWTEMDKVRFSGHAIAGREIRTKGRVLITFDENGFTADQSVYLRPKDEDSELVWTVHVHGLSGSTRVVTDREGQRSIFKATTEGDF